jgi:predicted Zn-dependent protease
VIDSPEINLVILPGVNKVIVFTGMLLFPPPFLSFRFLSDDVNETIVILLGLLPVANTEAGIATFISHELGHVMASKCIFMKTVSGSWTQEIT